MASISGRILAGVGAAMALLAAQPASASDWSVAANVTIVEGSYIPNTVDFQINQAAGSCAAGTWLNWTLRGSDEPSQIANAQGIYSLLMTALASGKQVQLYGTNSGCTVQFMWLLG